VVRLFSGCSARVDRASSLANNKKWSFFTFHRKLVTNYFSGVA
jgi:hypothetical protein